MPTVPAALLADLRLDPSRTLLAMDFDGTLAPIVADPAQSRLVPGALPTLRHLAGTGAQVVIVTGRDVRTVLDLSGLTDLPGLRVEGLYGAESWRAGELTSAATPAALDGARAALPRLVAAHAGLPGVWIEDKGLSLVLHGRRSADPAAALAPLLGPVTQLGEELGLDVHPGKSVLELRLPGFDKGLVLRRLVAELQPAALLYAGDDLGDLPAFAAVGELRDGGLAAWSVAVVSEEAPEVEAAADVAVAGPEEFRALLAAI